MPAAGPERERLTRMIAEVKQLAERRDALDAISYPLEEIEDYGLRKKSVVSRSAAPTLACAS
jgi:hypothetical protein